MEEGKQIVKVDRNLDLESSRQLKKDLVNKLDQGVQKVELNFSDTVFIDSSGLGKLLLFNEKFTEAGGEFKIINVTHPDVVKLFRLINLEKFIAIDYSDL